MPMPRACRPILLLLAAAVIASGSVISAQSAQPTPKPAPPATAGGPAPKPKAKPGPVKHTVLNASDMQWGPAPDSLPAGAQMSVLDGDPSKPGLPFVIRAKFPDGYKVPPHWHPSDEHVSVISGALMVGVGDKWDDAKMTTLNPGGYAKLPKMHHHFAGAKGETVIQIHAVGPFAITYVNPNDDPRKKTQ
jgi:quercetin dioxygenase-like cupin family protein